MLLQGWGSEEAGAAFWPSPSADGQKQRARKPQGTAERGQERQPGLRGHSTEQSSAPLTPLPRILSAGELPCEAIDIRGPGVAAMHVTQTSSPPGVDAALHDGDTSEKQRGSIAGTRKAALWGQPPGNAGRPAGSQAGSLAGSGGADGESIASSRTRCGKAGKANRPRTGRWVGGDSAR